MGKAKAKREFDLEDFPGQPLKLTISSSHGEPLSRFNTHGYDLLTYLIPSGIVHFSKISHSPRSSLHRDDPSGHLFCNQQLPDTLRPHQTFSWNLADRGIMDLVKYTTVTKREGRLTEKAGQAGSSGTWRQNSRK